MLAWPVLTAAGHEHCGAPISRTARSAPPRCRGLSTCFLVGVLCVLFGSSGCTSLRQWAHNRFKVGPNYCKPQAPVASEWIDYQNPEVVTDQPNLAEWWHVFNDANLNGLIETAYRQNISLRAAGTRILAARAERGIAAGELFPQYQDAVGAYVHAQVPGQVLPLPNTFSFWTTGFAAAWELDFWGRFRRAIEATDAELDASIENYDDVMVVLLGEVASSYTQVRAFQDRLGFAWQNVVSQYNGYQIAADKFMVGTATERDLQQAKQILEQTRALIPRMESGIRQANNQLCVLLGMPPRELTEIEVGTYERELMPLKATVAERIERIEKAVAEFTKTKRKNGIELPELLESERDPNVVQLLKPLEPRQRTPVAPPEVIVGIPADLIRRRPDVRRAERHAAAQSAVIGVAEADFYPRFSIVGFVGGLSPDLGNLFSSKSYTGLIAPNFQWSILNYGRILNNVRLQDARFQGLAYEYQNAVLRAGKEVEDGIIGYLKSQEETANLYASVAAAERTVQISFDQYRDGVIDFTPVVLFESTLASQQDNLAVARANIALNLIAIYRALGGGWEMRLASRGGYGVVPAGAPLDDGQRPRIEPLPPPEIVR
jgi:outer membrane protein TolC